eukprot:CAMPEP_0173234000 /NCGR_PEP_ID=MMETSP1142-20121109/9955_1 /TAXON_ID=483371 /ORGANISM="non described non described, Strain CCMP2298" /LENGTH=235 /DNA_ID=CAMNT_0014163937 /DNA_START=127 /DNA_END=834 /DNA_ORIENTATION=+
MTTIAAVKAKITAVEAESAAVKAKMTAVEAESASLKADTAAAKAENRAIKGTVASLEVDSRRLQLYVSILQGSGDAEGAGGMERVSAHIIPATGGYAACTYTGQMRGGERHGLGGATWATGRLKSYDGQWKDNKIHGQGIMEYRNGDVYEGRITDGNSRNGQGLYTWINGTSYKGQWQVGKQQGRGVYTYRNGDSEEGLWEVEKRQGLFILTKADGTRWNRVYKDNVQTSETQIV